ncbi:putative tigger transposable element-derived protein 1-like [Ditylenchus destructor]|uniref:Tigger transposable element-derived protein 1-like n=1 Tax=Ditylenchus destructor TaxID=166010 RepID=A0AAD4MF34_9BILA|nr:putative tigger transposable element-derived protein 1-like [Ditylenchus destructor]
MAGQPYDELFEDLFLDQPGAQPSASAESQESQITSKTTDTANSSDSDADEDQFKTRSLKSYPIAFKLEVIDFAIKKNSDHAASKFYKVDRKTVREWRKNEARYRRESMANVRGGQKKNLPGQGRPLDEPEYDRQLAQWIRQERALKGRTTRSVMFSHAQVLAKRFNLDIKVTVISTGHEHSRTTVVLTARSDGKKVKPMVLIPRKRPVKEVVKNWESSPNQSFYSPTNQLTKEPRCSPRSSLCCYLPLLYATWPMRMGEMVMVMGEWWNVVHDAARGDSTDSYASTSTLAKLATAASLVLSISAHCLQWKAFA